jgi:hypothetical protein
VAEEPRLEPCEPIAHGIGAAVHDRQLNSIHLFVVIEHVGAIGGKCQFDERARKGVAGLDDGKEAARGEVARASACA